MLVHQCRSALACFSVAALFIACSPKLDLPPNALIDCGTGQACPNGLVCRASIGRCVDPNVSLDAPAVSGTPSVTPPQGKEGTPFTIAFDVSKPLAAAPTMEVQIQDKTFTADLDPSQSSGQHYVFHYTAKGPLTEPEGQADCLVTLVDTVGNTAKGLPAGKFLLDFTPPRIATAVVQYLPATDNPLGSAVTRASAGTTIHVAVFSDEALSTSAVPVMTASNGVDTIPFTLVPNSLNDRGAIFEGIVPPGVSDSPSQYEPSIAGWTDSVGNQVTATFSTPALLVETAQPALAVDQSQVEYLRAPEGNAASETPDGGFPLPAGPYFAIAPADSLSGALTLPAATFRFDGGTSVARVRFWTSPKLENLLGEASPLDGGVWPRTRLAALDAPSLYVTALDQAGNESDPVHLDNAEWVATPRIPASGLTSEKASLTSFVTPAVEQSLLETTTLTGPELGGTDGEAVLARAEASWRQRVQTGTAPSARMALTMAYDSARGRVVLFGGYGPGQVDDDTWEWDGARWVDRTPNLIKPTARKYATMAYDASRGRVVLFGGFDSAGNNLQDTWEWDGTSWVDRTPASPGPSPDARYGQYMAYDSRRGTIVLFGGYGGAGQQPLQDTWEWDGRAGTWTNRTPATLPASWPSPRLSGGMDYDSARGKMFLFGGWNRSNGGFDEAWEWDGDAGTWTNRTPAVRPASWPGGRYSFQMVYDRARSVMVLFAGIVGGVSGAQDTWEWDGSTWTQKTPAVSPSARSDYGMTYDVAHRQVVMFGGSGGPLQDTFTWDGTSWVHPITAAQASPGALAFQAMTYDSARGRMVLFGGQDNGGNASQLTWDWDGASGRWLNRTPGTIPASWPAARIFHSMAFDSGRAKTVMFGGADASNVRQDTWEWDGKTGTWTNRTPGTIPASWPSIRKGAAMAYDAARGTVVLFGGQDDAGGYFNDTWEWDGLAGTWTNRTPGTLPASWPSGRSLSAMVYDSARGKMMMFGGVANGIALQVNQELWEWDGANGTWTNLTPASIPASWPGNRYGHSMAYDSAGGVIVLFGGQVAANYKFDTWEWNGTSWTEKTPSAFSPAPRGESSLAYDGARGRTVLFGGTAQDPGLYEWDADPARQPAVQLVTSAVNPGIGTVTGLRVRAFCGGTAPGQAGAALWGWSNGLGGLTPAGWNEVKVNGAGISASLPYLPDPSAALIDWTASTQAEAQSYVLTADARQAFQCRPVGFSGSSGQEAAVAADYLEVRVRYLAP
jgi:hypothetical protein